MRATLTALVALALLPGCTPSVLRQHSVSLAGANSDLRYREVIENLAMIYENPCTLPAYSSIYSGAMDVLDGAQFGETTTWIHSLTAPNGFAAQTMDIPLSRSVKGTLTLDPTIVPEKLRALRAACQFALFGEVLPDAYQNILEAYDPSRYPPGYYFGVANELRELSQFPWLGKGHSRHDVPNNACYWAGCGGYYVWVCPEGMESFSRFVLVFQRIARYDFTTLYQPFPSTKQVKWNTADLKDPTIQTVTVYVDELGNLAYGKDTAAPPLKARSDNVGHNSDLKAVINSVIKSP